MQIRKKPAVKVKSELGTFQKLKNRARKDDEKAAHFDGGGERKREGEKGERCRC